MKMREGDKTVLMPDTHKIRGFTLIELSIVMIIVGLLLSTALQGWNIFIHNQRIDVTRENIQKSEQAIKSYLHMNYHYPCPANRKLKRGQSDFGKSLKSCYNPDDPYLDQDGVDPVTISAKGRNNEWVVMGTIPFKSLGIPDADALDGWGRMLQYAVTERLTNPYFFNQKAGAIDVVDGNGNSRVVPPGSVQFIILSTGEDGVGGISSNGIPILPCQKGLLETENCNDDATFMDTMSRLKIIKKGEFPSIERNTTITDFDDFIAYKQYDPDFNLGSGLFILYQGSCPQDFIKIKLSGNRRPVDILYLSKRPSSDSGNGSNNSSVSLCYSPYYSATLSLTIAYTDGTLLPCPQGWTEIGYRGSDSSYAGDTYEIGDYQVCAR